MPHLNKTRSHAGDLRGASQLVIDATRGVTSVVEAMHLAIAGGPAALGQPLAAPAIAPIYRMIRGVTHLVGTSIDLALAPLAPLLGSSAPGIERELMLAALNGVFGDYLCERKNPLAIAMALRQRGEPLELSPGALSRTSPHAGRKIVVLVHGLCMTDHQWTRGGHDHGAALAADLGYTPVYVHYNTGLHVSSNGRELAAQLEQLVAAWPVALDELAILGHSMGGLVARSALHAGEQAGHAWRSRVTALITLGTPHHGAPLERAGHWVDRLLELSRYSAPLARLGRRRSAGILDLRYGNVLGEHRRGFDRFEHRDDRRPLPLPDDVACYAIAGTVTAPLGPRLASDGLVPVSSALGVHSPAQTLGFPDDHRWIAAGVRHIDLLGAAAVYATIRSWLSSTGETRTPIRRGSDDAPGDPGARPAPMYT